MKTSRREFLKISAFGLGGLAFINPFVKWLAEDQPTDDSKAKRFPTYCEICFWKCAGWIYTNPEGKVWKIVGNEADQHSFGRFCPRGTGGVGMYYDQDRLRTPLMRVTNPEGKQEYKPVSWDEALEFIAKKLAVIKEKHGAESVVLFSHGSGGSYWEQLLKAYGCGNNTAPSYAQCRGPREAAFVATFGKSLGSPEPTDIKNTRCLVLIGSHLGENMHNGQVQEMAMAMENGATIITVDPRFSTVASKSKFWLPIKPATDIALLLAWINVIIYEEWYDKKYVEKYTHGFEQLKEHVKDFTPQWAYGITNLKPDQIIKTAKEMADAAPAVIVHPGRHVVWYGDDTQRLRAIAILNALLGSWGRRGGFYTPEKIKISDMLTPEFPKPKRTWRDDFPDKYPLAGVSLASGFVEATIPNPKRNVTYKAWIVNGTNLINTLPNQKETLEAINNLELLVVVDTMPVEITGYADIVLPECTYIERYDEIRDSAHRKPSIALRMPATEPLYDSKPAWWMAKKLADKMGYSAYFPYNDISEMLDWQLKKLGSSLDEMKNLGVKNFERQYDDLYFTENQEIEFNTNTGKIELYSTAIADAGFEPMPVYKPLPEPPAGFYRLNYGRAPMHTFGRTVNNPNLAELMKENSLWVNPKVAQEWGLKNGQNVKLKNQNDITASFPLKVRITERIRWDSVYMVHGFGTTKKELTRAFAKGANDTELMSNVLIDPLMGGTGMRGNFVTFVIDSNTLKQEAE